MTDVAANAQSTDDKPKTKNRFLPVLIGLVAGALLGGAGFYAMYSGLILSADKPSAPAAAAPEFAFVAIDPVTISLAPNASARLLRFSAQFEVATTSVAEVERLRPRLVDMINLYLRAVEPQELNDPAAMLRLRAQLLRRAQIIVGDGHIRDILITEFVLT